MHRCICLLSLLLHQGTSRFPTSAQDSWQNPQFMVLQTTIRGEFVYPTSSSGFFNENSINKNSVPMDTLEMSNNMFRLYLDHDELGVHEREDFLEYFRHDLGINLFHLHWHSANPFNGDLVQNHRRGESFYYMHQQMLARYNVERIANGESPVPSVHDAKELENQINKKYQLPFYNKPTNGGDCAESYSQMQKWTNNIIDAIIQGYATASNNASVQIDVDLLGNMIQPSTKTPNEKLYGNIHNMGHNNIAYCHYKGNEKLNIQLLSDLGDTRTAPRCPVFYRFHTFVDDMFKLFQNKLPEYTKDQLDYPGVELKSLKIITEKGPTKTLETCYQMIRMDNLYMKNKLTQEYNIPFHIQHENFKYEFTIENSSGENKFGMIRIFVAPVYDVKGKEMSLSAQRSLFIELDKFRINFPTGESTVVRQAEDSIVTVKFDEFFRKYIKEEFKSLDPEETSFCACGWPDYFLLPSGTLRGMKFYLFAMLSDELEDSMSYDPGFKPPNPKATKRSSCKEAYSYCGMMETVYPDSKPMGYPWDRPAPKWASNLAEFSTPNMLVQEIVIKHVNKTLPPIDDGQDFPYLH